MFCYDLFREDLTGAKGRSPVFPLFNPVKAGLATVRVTGSYSPDRS